RISVPKRECERARGRAHSGIALAYVRAFAMERGHSCPHSALDAGRDACVPVFSPLLRAGFCNGGLLH
ncbi:MAG: hypothetical protein ACRD6X_09345, partial [Pyrinomonadaceae bacterium]